MADNINPYESPQTEAASFHAPEGRVLTETMLLYLKGASSWLRFIGIVSFIFLGILAVVFLTVIIAFQSEIPSIPGMAAVGSSMFLVIMLISLALFFFPTYFLFQFGRKIRIYIHTGDASQLETAFKNNKSLWTFIGILTMIGLAFNGLVFIGTIISALAGIANG
jgi:magnesium-transporting ATPase (P-type)